VLNLLSIPIEIQEISHPLLIEKEVRLSVLRLDTIHPAISGNKLFKLFYYLKDVSSDSTIITFGGNYSNHLAATAAAGKMLGIKTIAYVRGYEQQAASHTLNFCRDNGMELHFLSREEYNSKTEEAFLNDITSAYSHPVIIPEGGYGVTGAKGAALITEYYKGKEFTHVIAAVGTATTLAGLSLGAEPSQSIIGISVLKDLNDFGQRMSEMIGEELPNYALYGEYHFGGYAKKNTELLDFMNQFYRDTAIPTEFVYTGKMLFGAWDMIANDKFPCGSNVLAIHTGGLQGNLSLPHGTLIFESN
jgi:1-aminocyclopropane-1-carboxylate deaminase